MQQKYQAPDMIALLVYLLLLCQHATSSPAEEYDFIIVGGGTAGCLLARRLSENPDWRILVLEAGGEPTFFQRIPLLASGSTFTLSNWGFMTEKNESFGLSNRNQRLSWSQGRLLGGSSVLSGLVYTRGAKQQYDEWAALGNTGWSFDEVLPYFKKFEKMTITEYQNDTEFHSTTGELPISFPSYISPLGTSFIEAGKELGYKEIDYNRGDMVGVSYTQVLVENGIKMNAFESFIRPILPRKNLIIQKRSFVTKILINPQTKLAYGVEYKLFNFIPQQAIAKKEVILSAGSINSPKILMLSGIGPKEHLEEIGIPLIQDLQVGCKLFEQPGVSNLFFITNGTTGLDTGDPFTLISSALQYITKRSGPLANTSPFETLAFFDVGDDDGYPEIETYFISTLVPTTPFFLGKYGEYDDVMNEFYKQLKFQQGFTMIPNLVRPYSHGRVRLRTKNPLRGPKIYPDFFSDPRDMKNMIGGIRRSIEFTKTTPFQKYGVRMFDEPIPPCKDNQFGSDEYWECNIRQISKTNLHATGTCKMGPESDPDAVVDPSLRVYNIQNLRVADTSVGPTPHSAHTVSLALLVAEKCADMLKMDWKNKT